MKAILLTGIREMEMRDLPDPVLQSDTDVLLRMVAVGVCGSDVHYYTTGRIGSQVVQYPFAVGHECSGIVEEVGKAVTQVAPGDRVAVEPAMYCFQCDQCRAGRHNTCRNLRFLGCPGQAEGCLGERIVMPEACCIPLPEKVSMDQAALAEPLSIGLYGVDRSVPMPGARIGILGAGPIGLSVLLPAKDKGVEKIYVTDKLDARLTAAAKVGATWTGNPDTRDVMAEIAAAEPLGLDAVFECCGEQDAIDQAVKMLKPGGKLMLIGIPQVDRISFRIDAVRRAEICIVNVRRQVRCVEPALQMIADGRLDVDFMVTHRFPFEQTKEAFDLVDGYRDGVIKAMIDFPDEGR